MTADAAAAGDGLRRTLFGDLPLDEWPPGDDPAGTPWDGFVRARAHLAAGDEDLAVREWAQIANPILALESRHVLQAWRFLRERNVHPDESIAGEVLGVVCEVAVGDGHDVLAAYRDGTVRYLNHAGGATIVDAVPPDIVPLVEAVLAAGQALADQIGVWDQPALPPLPAGHTRLCLLTRGGHRFGQGPDAALQVQPGATEVFAAATALLVAVVELG